MSGVFSFPNPVNEVSARLVAAGVVLIALVALVFQVEWLLPVLAYGFVARVLSGPTLSPLGQLVTRVVTPRAPFAYREAPGPAKRFAQGMGAVMSVSAVILYFGFGLHTAAWVLCGVIVVAATLESAFGVCIGCKVFAVLMRAGVVPEAVCADCANIWARAERAPA
ncbi:MAG: hypothetical protein QOE08_1088 [Thermoleophilaceae bacterium]|nr:hypothetical protein [Thermoleophilaceae bacterium]